MSLFDKIRKFGYEIEYPVDWAEHVLEDLRNKHMDIYDDYYCHTDGLGIEFAFLEPAIGIDNFKHRIAVLYGEIEETFYEIDARINRYGFNNDDTGVHIRIDVSDWTKAERYIFTSFFSSEMEKFDEFVRWVESYTGRNWNNWNESCSMKHMWDHIFDENYGTSRRSGYYNIRYEKEYFGRDVFTIEVRMFAVEEYIEDALKQVGLVERVTNLTEEVWQYMKDKGILLEDLSVDLLYEIWGKTYG